MSWPKQNWFNRIFSTQFWWHDSNILKGFIAVQHKILTFGQILFKIPDYIFENILQILNDGHVVETFE